MHQEITDAMLQALIEKVGRHYQEDWAQQALERDTLPQETADRDPALLIGATSGTSLCNSDLAEQLERCKVPPRYRDITFEEIERRGVSIFVQPQVDEVKDFAVELPVRLDAGDGLLLRGPVGTLKTTLAVALMAEALRAGRTTYFASAPALANAFVNAKNQGENGWQMLGEKMRRVSMLVLDDLGAEGGAAWLLLELEGLVAERYDEKRSTIITTNLTSDMLRARYPERMMDRIRSTVTLVTLDAPESLRDCRPAISKQLDM